MRKLTGLDVLDSKDYVDISGAKRHVSVKSECWGVTQSRSSSPHPWQALIHSISEKRRIPTRGTSDVYDRCRCYLIFVGIIRNR